MSTTEAFRTGSIHGLGDLDGLVGLGHPVCHGGLGGLCGVGGLSDLGGLVDLGGLNGLAGPIDLEDL